MAQQTVRGQQLVELADEIAVEAHDGVTDKAGRPYIEHPRRVAARLPEDDHELRAAALLHDVLEDTAMTGDDLRARGIPDEVVEIVEALSKRPGEDYAAAVRRAGVHPRARLVKSADVADNSDPDRLAELDPDEAARLSDKYALARRVLTETAPLHVRPWARWRRFEEDAPDLAGRIRRRFEANLHHVLGTIRSDGSPRLSGTEVRIADGQVTLGMMPGSAKLLDVRRDPRVELHSAPLEEDLAEGDAKLSGLLVELSRDPAGGDGPDGSFFHVDIGRASLTRVEENELVITSWTPDGGLREVRRS